MKHLLLKSFGALTLVTGATSGLIACNGDLNKQIEDLNKKIDEQTQMLQELKTHIQNTLKDAFAFIYEKGLPEFLKLNDNLKNILTKLNDAVTKKDLEKVIEKITSMTDYIVNESLNELNKDVKKQLEGLKEKLEKITIELKEKVNQDALDSHLNKIEKLLENKLDEYGLKTVNESLKKIKEDLDKLKEKEIESLKTKLELIDKSLKDKASDETLTKLKEEVLTKLEEVKQELDKKVNQENLEKFKEELNKINKEILEKINKEDLEKIKKELNDINEKLNDNLSKKDLEKLITTLGMISENNVKDLTQILMKIVKVNSKGLLKEILSELTRFQDRVINEINNLLAKKE